MILVIKHIPVEGQGMIGDYLCGAGYDVVTRDLSRGDVLPETFDGIEAVVSLGGPMNVYEEGKYPFLKAEDVFLKKVMAGNVPFLGICLGAQLLAKATGARVKKAPVEEIGFSRVDITSGGKRDPLFLGLKSSIDVFQWHGDTFDIPEGGELLATSGVCAGQAFRVGAKAYGLQFHVEVNAEMVSEWVREYSGCGDEVFRKKAGDILIGLSQKGRSLNVNAVKICRNFDDIIHKKPGINA
jgi:GMP synthase (glutamine-hydrolysing)